MVTGPVNPLPAYRDRTVSRFRARDETRDTLAHARTAQDAVGSMCERVFKARAQGKGRFSAEDVLGLSRVFVDSYAKVANVVLSRDHARDATRVRPNGAERSHLRVHALRDEASTVWVTLARLQVARRFASFETSRNEFSWYVHAAERLHERLRNAERADVAIASAILDNLAMLRLATTIRSVDGLDDRLAVPCMGGLLCGAFVAVGPSDFEGACLRVDGTRYREGRIVPMSLIVGCDVSWRAWTFVGPDDLFPDQRRYVGEWEEMRASVAPVNELALESFSYAALTDMRDPREDGDMARLISAFGPRGFAGAAEAMTRFLKHPEMLRAAGALPSGAPPPRRGALGGASRT